jgi:hypothetical protein
VNNIAAGRHSLVHGRLDERLLWRGGAISVVSALERVGTGFDIVARIDAAAGVTVVHGHDNFDYTDDPRRDPIGTARELLSDCDRSTFVIINQAGILLQDPSNHDIFDRTRVATLELALAEATTKGSLRNTAVLLAPSPNDLPIEVRAGGERLALVEVGLPTPAERRQYMRAYIGLMGDASHLDPRAVEELVEMYVRHTEGMSLRELESMIQYARNAHVSALQPRDLVRRLQFGEMPDYWATVLRDLPRIKSDLESTVIGQQRAIDEVVAGLAAASLRLTMTGDPHGRERQPRLMLLLLGSTGVGKTELAKAIAKALFGDEAAYTRFDMAQYAAEHSADGLTGAPPGYVGYEAGGALTNAARERPNQVFLLDEIDKAHPRVHDRMMSVADDGRVTDAQGRVAYFGEAIILMTSNLGAREFGQKAAGLASHAPDAGSPVDLMSLSSEEVEATFTSAARNYFVSEINRPEIWGRLEQGVVVFEPLRPQMVAPIVEKILDATSFGQGPALAVDRPSATKYAVAAMSDPAAAMLGGRQIRNIFRRAFLRLASWVVLEGVADCERLRVRFDIDGTMHVRADDRAEVAVLPA